MSDLVDLSLKSEISSNKEIGIGEIALESTKDNCESQSVPVTPGNLHQPQMPPRS